MESLGAFRITQRSEKREFFVKYSTLCQTGSGVLRGMLRSQPRSNELTDEKLTLFATRNQADLGGCVARVGQRSVLSELGFARQLPFPVPGEVNGDGKERNDIEDHSTDHR
jgi:hypothetical protein